MIAECQAILAAESPTPITDFAVILERLWLHYPESKLSETERAQLLADWIRLAGHLPPDILQAATDAYVTSPARFAPTVGQILAVAEKLWSYRKLLAGRARETLALIGAHTSA